MPRAKGPGKAVFRLGQLARRYTFKTDRGLLSDARRVVPHDVHHLYGQHPGDYNLIQEALTLGGYVPSHPGGHRFRQETSSDHTGGG
jgi:hypothetical protein